MKHEKTCLKQSKHVVLENQIRDLRAEGKSYREIAEVLHVSIAHISRVLREPKQQDEIVPTKQGETASKVFCLLEKGLTLSQIVIRLKLEPEVVKDLYAKWLGLNQTDVNQPNLERLNQKLDSHISDQYGLDRLLEKVWNAGVSRRDNCVNRLGNDEGFCRFWPEVGEEPDDVFTCVFCPKFQGEETISIDISPNIIWPFP